MRQSRSLSVTILLAAALVGATVAGHAFGEGPQSTNARFTLVSRQDTRAVAPGTTIEWEARVRVAGSGNAGLALVSFDLVQDDGNPELFDFPPGERAPSGMDAFDRPAGFANPSEDPWGSGYGGTPVGPEGRRNLAQIGGAQNTFGVAPQCLGPEQDICMGQDANVARGIGQSASGQLVARGSFSAPSTPGTYRVRVSEVVASLLARVNVAPQPSIVVPASVRVVDDELSFTVR